LFNIRLSADLDAERLAQYAFERCDMPRRRPQLELRVARCPQLKQHVVSAVVQLDADDGL
jgi:hypothetical protein